MEYEITAPDGRRFRITAPEGATEDQVLSYAQRQITAPPATTMDSVTQGLGDAVQGGAQALTRALPRGVVDTVNNATSYVNSLPMIGPVTRALGMTPATPEQIDQQTVAREQNYQASRATAGAQPGDWDWGRMAGNLVPATAAALATRSPQTVMQAVRQGVGQGALFGALEPVTGEGESFSDQKVRQVAGGAVLGGVGGGAGYLAGRLLAPNADPQARLLYNEGVQTTLGQSAGGGVRAAENRATSIPVVGNMIAAGQRNATETFNTAVGNRVLAPLGEQVPRGLVGRDLLTHVEGVVGRAYDDVIQRGQAFAPDTQFLQDLRTVVQQVPTQGTTQELSEIIQRRVLDRIQTALRQRGGNQITPAEYQSIRSELGQLAANRSGSADAQARELGDALFGVQDAFDNLFARTNPAVAPDFEAARTAYAQLVRMRGASAAQGATDGVFTAPQFAAAVRRNDPSVNKNAYARGEALMQDLSDAGRSVLPSNVPDSGTGGRLMQGGTLAALLAGDVTGLISTPAALAGGAAVSAYTPLGQRLLSAMMLAQRPAAVEAAGRALLPSGAPISVPLASMLLSPPERTNQVR